MWSRTAGSAPFPGHGVLEIIEGPEVVRIVARQTNCIPHGIEHPEVFLGGINRR